MSDDIKQGAAAVALTVEQIELFAAQMVKQGSLNWAGFREDDDGKYTIPVVSKSVYDLIRALLAAQPAASAHADRQEADTECKTVFGEDCRFARNPLGVTCVYCGKPAPETADRQGVALSDEWQLVPVTPTPWMLTCMRVGWEYGQDAGAEKAYREGLAAAPEHLARASSSRAEVEIPEREEFEAWFRRNVNPNATMTRHPDDWPNTPGEYRSIITEDRWKTWLGRAEVERSATRTIRTEKPSVEALSRMAYILRLAPEGETVPSPMLLVLKDQYVAAMRAAQGDK